MGWLFEDPSTVLIAGGLIEVFLVVALVKTGRGVLFFAIGGVLVVVALLVLLEWAVVTDRESIEDAIAHAAAVVETNKLEDILDLVVPEPDGKEMRDRLSLIMPSIHVTRARASILKVEVFPRRQPPSARVVLVGKLRGRLPEQDLEVDDFMRKITVDLVKIDGRWMLRRFSDSPVQEAE